MKQITDSPAKMTIVDRLLKDGAIDFAEAIALMEVEQADPVYIQWPQIPTPPYQPLPWGTPVSPWYQPCISTNEVQVTVDGNGDMIDQNGNRMNISYTGSN